MKKIFFYDMIFNQQHVALTEVANLQGNKFLAEQSILARKRYTFSQRNGCKKLETVPDFHSTAV